MSKKRKIIGAVFARFGTCEKAFLPIYADQKVEAAKKLGEIHGGSWVYLNKIEGREGFTFSDNATYSGDPAAPKDFAVSHLFYVQN